ncbi:alpha/beta fold hydrolase [Phycicoccus sp. Root101]|uniref:alpha/beta fold hydrolase n=1 Tax=Phycicoccus sp. Root101 TaxID=1736421 RepID=UPI000B11FEA2|nr:alpha/beta hydrolase [Phycicoccus sp. Root101]
MTEGSDTGLGPVQTVQTDVLQIGYIDVGERSGPCVALLHGFPYDVHSFEAVVPRLTALGFRVIVPYLRGHGPTRFLSSTQFRSGQQGALGADVIALLDALTIDNATLAGFDWGGRAACVAAAVWPHRVNALVSVNGYLIQDIKNAMTPIRPDLEAGLWYFFYFLTERGRAGLTRNRKQIAEVIWRRNSPLWAFDDTTLDRAARAFCNDDYVEVVLHSYRHRLGAVEGDPRYASIEALLAGQPSIPVPCVTLDGEADGNFPATDGRSTAAHFSGPRRHHQVADAGHNLPQEAPEAFVAAILEARELRPGHRG